MSVRTCLTLAASLSITVAAIAQTPTAPAPLYGPQQAQRKTHADRQLHVAIRAEDLAGVRDALTAGASLYALSKEGETPLTEAAAQGNARIFSMLVGAGADINAANDNHWTPLMMAVQRNQIDIVRLLLQLGADLNLTDNTGRSAIFYTNGDEMRTLLLSAHPDFSITDRDGKSILGEQSFALHNDFFDQLADAGAYYTSATDALYGASANGDIGKIDQLLAQGADPNGITGTTINSTPLMMAAFKGHTAAVRDLIAHGGDPAVADRNKQDTLFWACSSKRLDTVEAVLEALTDFNGSDANFRRSALMTVVRAFDEPGMVRRLVKAGVAINATDISGDTALMYAAREDHRRDVTALLDAGADATVRNRQGKTAADLAHARHDDGLAEVLDRAASEGPQQKH